MIKIMVNKKSHRLILKEDPSNIQYIERVEQFLLKLIIEVNGEWHFNTTSNHVFEGFCWTIKGKYQFSFAQVNSAHIFLRKHKTVDFLTEVSWLKQPSENSQESGLSKTVQSL